jgi:hypothetical protein
MKISWGFNSLPPDSPAAARSCLTINLLGLPGLGSWIAGRRVGLVQAALALAGLAMTVASGILIVVTWSQTGQMPEDPTFDLLLGTGGIFLFLLGWVWGFATGLSLMRAARRGKP